ncbi:MAG: PEP-CTERM sorting domain-containing protein [Acidobacteriia bacterium]|nr:PEP-CTERM sorting domain-containing protein [Terriglobia bacterium]
MKRHLLSQDRRIQRPLLVMAAVLTVLASTASADTTVSMQLIGPTGAAPNLAGVYTDPYTATVGVAGQTGPTISGVAMQVLCDDFTTDVNIGDFWQAHVTNMSQLNGTTLQTQLKFDTSGSATAASQLQDYMTVAYLAQQIMAINQSTPAGAYQAEILSFAMWGVFDPTTIDPNGPLSGHWIKNGDLTLAQADLAAAQAAVVGKTGADFSNVSIYTPSPLTASQEYIVVTPEPGTFGMLALCLLGLVWGSRRLTQMAQPAK